MPQQLGKSLVQPPPADQGSIAQALQGAFGGQASAAAPELPPDNRAMRTPEGAYGHANLIMDAYNKGPEAVAALKASNPELFK